ncbi:MAG: cyclic nucleotide-binding domain-containing protein [Pseudomonadota bacterium]
MAEDPFPSEAVLAACADLPVLEFAPGSLLLNEGAHQTDLFILLEGTVVILKGTVEVARIGERAAIFGEMSALLNIPCSATVRALDTVRAHHSTEAAALLARRPDLAWHTARTLALRLHHATTYLADIKAQYADHEGHFGMMDRVLDSLMQHQETDLSESRSDPTPDDPRL